MSVKRALGGFKRRTTQTAVQQARPLTHEILEQVAGVLRDERESFVAWRTVWRMSMSFYGMLRWDEVSKLTVADIRMTEERMTVFIKRSKTDQLSRGASVEIHGHVGAEELSLTCPIRLTKQYIRRLGAEAQTEEAGGRLLQPRMNPRGHQSGSDKIIGYDTALRDLRRMIGKIGLPEKAVSYTHLTLPTNREV